MIIVDDQLSLAVLGGRARELAPDEPVATTWGFHFRLMRALADDARVGRLTRASTSDVRRQALSPPPATLVVLDPRELTGVAAGLAVRHRLNLLGAELFAAARSYDAGVRLSAGKVGRGWPEAMAVEGIDLVVVD